MSEAETRTRLTSIIGDHNADPTEPAILEEIQEVWCRVTPDIVTVLAEILGLPRVHVERAATAYHFLSRTYAGLARAASSIVGPARIRRAMPNAGGRASRARRSPSARLRRAARAAPRRARPPRPSRCPRSR
jgi:hypothetical protein